MLFCRGLVALQALHRLESLTGKPIYQLFDYICGVSTGIFNRTHISRSHTLSGNNLHLCLTDSNKCVLFLGAILAFMLGVFQIPLNECEELYRKLGSDVFKQNLIVGTVKMGWSHAYYDSQIWEEILKYVMEFTSSFYNVDYQFYISNKKKCFA